MAPSVCPLGIQLPPGGSRFLLAAKHISDVDLLSVAFSSLPPGGRWHRLLAMTEGACGGRRTSPFTQHIKKPVKAGLFLCEDHLRIALRKL